MDPEEGGKLQLLLMCCCCSAQHVCNCCLQPVARRLLCHTLAAGSSNKADTFFTQRYKQQGIQTAAVSSLMLNTNMSTVLFPTHVLQMMLSDDLHVILCCCSGKATRHARGEPF
jgi:hypothetical protein